MKVTISREKLLEGLMAVGATIPTKTTLPVLSNLLVETTERGLRLSGTDLDIAVSMEIAAEVDAPGAITIPATAGRRRALMTAYFSWCAGGIAMTSAMAVAEAKAIVPAKELKRRIQPWFPCSTATTEPQSRKSTHRSVRCIPSQRVRG